MADYNVPEGFQVYGNTTMAYLDADDNLIMNVSAPTVMISATAKLTVLASKPECVPGTTAFTPGWKDAWQYKADGTWEQFISST